MNNPRPLPMRLELRNHSPTGYEWGYNGSGPAQLALAIICDVLDVPADTKEPPFWTDDEIDGKKSAVSRALRLYQRFKDDHVARWPGPTCAQPFGVSWHILAEDVVRFIERVEAPEPCYCQGTGYITQCAPDDGPGPPLVCSCAAGVRFAKRNHLPLPGGA